ncbi:hypothetical protein ACHAPD_007760 [Fusarium lateritium]
MLARSLVEHASTLEEREDEDDPTTTKFNPGRLPESLEHLTIFHPELHSARIQLEYMVEELSGDILNRFEFDRDQALVCMRTLLEETGPERRLKKLKTIDFSDGLLDDPMVEDIRRVKNLARERGVEFIFGRVER